MGLLDDAVGYMAIGVWTNCLLFSWELVSAVQYFRNFRNDSPYLKLLVLIAVLNDAFGSAVICWWIYDITIINFGNILKLASSTWGLSAFAMSMGISVFITHSYLVWRFHRVSNMRIMSAILGAAALASLGYSAYCCYIGTQHQSPADRHIVSKSANILVGIEVGSDIAIAGSLVFFLLRHYLESEIQSTKALLLRLMLLTCETGVVTTAIALTALFLFVYKTESSVGLGLGFNLPRVYTLTLLFNLHIRQGGRTSSDSYGSSRTGSGGSRSNNKYSIRSNRNEGIATIPISLKPREVELESKDGSQV